jgi:hypothetical protein
LRESKSLAEGATAINSGGSETVVAALAPFFFRIERTIDYLSEEDGEDCLVSTLAPGAAVAFSVLFSDLDTASRNLETGPKGILSINTFISHSIY